MDYEKLKQDIQCIRYNYIAMNNSEKMTAILDALMLAEDLCDYNLCLDNDKEWAEIGSDILKIDPLTFP